MSAQRFKDLRIKVKVHIYCVLAKCWPENECVSFITFMSSQAWEPRSLQHWPFKGPKYGRHKEGWQLTFSLLRWGTTILNQHRYSVELLHNKVVHLFSCDNNFSGRWRHQEHTGCARQGGPVLGLGTVWGLTDADIIRDKRSIRARLHFNSWSQGLQHQAANLHPLTSLCPVKSVLLLNAQVFFFVVNHGSNDLAITKPWSLVLFYMKRPKPALKDFC